MDVRGELGRAVVGREVAVAFALLAALYLLRFVGVRALQLPAYLLIVAYDLVEVVVPALAPYHPIAFPGFLYLLAVVAAAVARRADAGDEAGLVRAAGGVCLVVGIISLLFGAAVGGPLIAPTDNPTPAAITGAAGALLLTGGWWLLRRGARRRPDPA